MTRRDDSGIPPPSSSQPYDRTTTFIGLVVKTSSRSVTSTTPSISRESSGSETEPNRIDYRVGEPTPYRKQSRSTSQVVSVPNQGKHTHWCRGVETSWCVFEHHKFLYIWVSVWSEGVISQVKSKRKKKDSWDLSVLCLTVVRMKSWIIQRMR
jgi:hypothetical protein